MATVEESVLLGATLVETWDRFFDSRGWASWVDGFGSVVAEEGYPDTGGSLRWRSIPAGRGEVRERVLDHEPRHRHLIAFSDPQMEGELDSRFAIEGEGTRLTQRLDYRLLERGPIARLGAVLFVRSQVGASMRRSQEALRRVVAEAPGLPG